MIDLTPAQRKKLIVALRAAEWELDNVAHDLGADRVTDGQWSELATALDHLCTLVESARGAVRPPIPDGGN